MNKRNLWVNVFEAARKNRQLTSGRLWVNIENLSLLVFFSQLNIARGINCQVDNFIFVGWKILQTPRTVRKIIESENCCMTHETNWFWTCAKCKKIVALDAIWHILVNLKTMILSWSTMERKGLSYLALLAVIVTLQLVKGKINLKVLCGQKWVRETKFWIEIKISGKKRPLRI